MLRNLVNELRQAEGEYTAKAEELRERVAGGGDPLSAEEREQMATWATDLAEQREQFRAFVEMAETDRDKGAIEEMRDIVRTDSPEVAPSADEVWRASEEEVNAIRQIGTPGQRRVELNIAARHNELILVRMGYTGKDLVDAAKRGWLMRYDAEEHAERGRNNAVRAYNIGSDAAGGYTVPTITSASLYDYMEFIGGMMQAGCDTIMTEGMEQIELPLIATHIEGTAKDGAGDVGTVRNVWDSWAGSAADRDDEVVDSNRVGKTGAVPTPEGYTAPKIQDTLTQVTLDAYRFDGYSVMTEEMRRSNIVGFADYLARALGRTLAKKIEYQLHFGTGSNMPQGVFANLQNDLGGNARVIPTQLTTDKDYLLPKDFTGAFARLDPGYTIEPNALKLLMHSGIMWYMAGQQNSEVYANADANLTFQSSLLNVPNRQLYGNPIEISAYMQPTMGTASRPIALIGHFMDGYVVRKAGTIELAASDDVRFLQSETVIRARCWADGEVRDPRAFVKLTTAAT